jgi:hypothetical protein
MMLKTEAVAKVAKLIEEEDHVRMWPEGELSRTRREVRFRG